MSKKAGRVVVDLEAGTKQFVVQLEQAKSGLVSFGRTGVSETKATRAAFKALEGNILDNKKAAEQFAEKLLNVGGLAKLAFPIVGAAAFGGMVYEIGEKMVDFVKKMKDAPGAVAASFRGLVAPMQMSNDELRVANDRLANEIDKLGGRRQNNLKLMLDEAVVAADKLAEALQKDLESIDKVLKENEAGIGAQLLGATPNSDVIEQAKAGKGRIQKLTDEMNADIRAAMQRGDPAGVSNAKIIGRSAINNEIKRQLEEVNEQIKTATTRATFGTATGGTEVRQTSELTALQIRQRGLYGVQDRAGLMEQGEDLGDRKTDLEAGKAALEEQKKLQNQILDLEIKRLTPEQQIFAEGQKRIVQEGAEYSLLQNIITKLEWQRRVSSLLPGLDKTPFEAVDLNGPGHGIFSSGKATSIPFLTVGARDQGPGGQVGFNNNRPVQPTNVEISEKVNDANLQNAVSFAILAERMRMSLMSTDDQIKALERLRQLGVSSLDLEVERQHILQSEYRSSAQAASEALNRNAQTLLAMGGAGNGVRAFFTEMDAESKNWAVSLGREVHDALNGAFESISQNIAKLATGQKTDFGKSFQSVGQHMVEGSTKNAMEKGIGALGSIFHNEGLGKGKPDGTKDNAYWVKFADDWLPAGDGSTDNAKGKIQKSIFGALTPHHYEGEDDDDDDDDDDDEEDKGKDGSAVGFWSKLGKGLLGALIPHAGGGDISPASAYLVGERGPEILTGMAGRITNNVDSMRALKAPSAGIYYSIDARGADSALADQNVRRALVAVHGSAVATSVQAMNELAKRRPQG